MLIVWLFSFTLVLLCIRPLSQCKEEAFSCATEDWGIRGRHRTTLCGTISDLLLNTDPNGAANLDRHHHSHERLKQDQEQHRQQHNTVLYIVRHTDVPRT